MMVKNKIIIHHPYVVTTPDGGGRLVADIDFPDVELCPKIEFSRTGYPRGRRQMWFEVENAYVPYLTPERGDAFLVGLIQPAMRLHCDIVCEAPISVDLLYKLQTYYCPAVANNSEDMQVPSIEAPMDAKPIASAHAVGTGVSGGVDSFEVIATHYHSRFAKYNLTHLCLFYAGAYDQDDDVLDRKEFQNDVKRAVEICEELGLSFVKVISNCADPELFRGYHLQLNSMRNISCIMALRKLFGVYLLASSVDIGKFDIKMHGRYDSAEYDAFTVGCVSSDGLLVLSAGSTKTRYEKTKTVAEFSPAHKFLHVCLSEVGGNCNQCMKCIRTLTTLDALGRIDSFTKVFDVEYYRRHRLMYLRWLYEQETLGENGDHYIHETYLKLRADIPMRLKMRVRFKRFADRCWASLRGVRDVLRRVKALRIVYMVVKSCFVSKPMKGTIVWGGRGNREA